MPHKSTNSISNNWRLISDQVMGGRSLGDISHDEDGLYHCLHLRGEVSIENNGGFLQIVHDLTEAECLDALQATGIRLLARGNEETYNLHLRTTDLTLPWQSYRVSFDVTSNWREFSIPFERFQAYKTGKPLSLKNLRRIGIVAIGRDFEADICIADVQFY